MRAEQARDLDILSATTGRIRCEVPVNGCCESFNTMCYPDPVAIPECIRGPGKAATIRAMLRANLVTAEATALQVVRDA